MNFLDIRINELMTKTDAHLLRSTQPYGWQGLYRAMRSGRLRNVVRVIDIACVLFLVVSIWAAYRFFTATEVLSAVKFGMSAAVMLIVAGQLKLSLMPHIQAERIIRQMKRIEILLLAKNHEITEEE
ncbi:MAG: hypothetical protein KUG74_06175 [Rhodobacteraceae bacterium]|nr:hypothetical protein [Paracoccaceae bacterium]